MKNTAKTYALLVANGEYQKMEKADLPCYARDLQVIGHALTEGLKIDQDNIRVLGGEGSVTIRSFARAIAEFETLLEKEDIFLFYFSGHGQPRELLFSDGAVTIQSIVSFIGRLPAKSKVVILDCCYSGATKVQEGFQDCTFEESLAAFAGSGIAVMASSAADSVSWLGDGGTCSLYTRIAAAAICSRRNIRAGKLSLTDINDEIRYLMADWNQNHPQKFQYPIYRDSMLGTVYFQVEEYHPYVTQKITMETKDYILQSVKPLSTGQQKRFAAFVITKTGDDTHLPEMTREIAEFLKHSDVYASSQSELRFKGKTADAIWCYFGHDEGDLIRSNHYAYTIWAERQEMKDLYFRTNRNAEVIDGIYVFWNTSYGIVKELQKTDTPDEKIIADYRTLSDLLIRNAEKYRATINEAENGTLLFEDVRKAHQGWIREVRELFFKLTDAPPAPLSSSVWSEAVMDLAGWVVDLATLLENRYDWNDPGDRWLTLQTVRRYERSLEKLGKIERLAAQA